jgi:lauroyl/myristoyl acyltransferase
MGLVEWATSGAGSKVLMRLSRLVPAALAYRLCDWAAGRLACQEDNPFVRTLRENMAVVHAIPPTGPAMDRVLLRLLRNTLYSYVDLFRAAGGDGRSIVRAVRIDPAVERLIGECRATGRGLLLVGAHMCSFDMLLLRLRELAPAVQVLSKADPVEGNCVMNDLRRAHGIDITPTSTITLRRAIRTLRAGGIVAIAADLPARVPADGAELTFFGRPTRLLVGHARLALCTGSQMVVGASVRVDRDVYRAEMAVVPQPPPSGDRDCDAVAWAQASVTVLERFIRQAPEQWLMPQPVWAGPPAEGVFA